MKDFIIGIVLMGAICTTLYFTVDLSKVHANIQKSQVTNNK